MDFLVANWFLVLVAVVSGGMLLVPALGSGAAAGGLSVQDAVHKMNREKGVLIDVRSDAEYAAEHVAQAKHVPLEQLEAKLPQLVKNKALPVLFVCAGGTRAQRAVRIAQQLGYQQAHAVAGGMKGWKNAKLPVVTASA